MWEEKLDKIIQEKALYGEKVNSGATEKEMQTFIDEIADKLNMVLPEQYTRVLKVMNGIEFNGVILYGIDERMLDSLPTQHVNGLLENNKIWYENEWQKQYLFLGESSISWYVYDLADKKYFELDNPSGTEIEMFNCFEDLLEKLLSDSLT